LCVRCIIARSVEGFQDGDGERSSVRSIARSSSLPLNAPMRSLFPIAWPPDRGGRQYATRVFSQPAQPARSAQARASRLRSLLPITKKVVRTPRRASTSSTPRRDGRLRPVVERHGHVEHARASRGCSPAPPRRAVTASPVLGSATATRRQFRAIQSNSALARECSLKVFNDIMEVRACAKRTYAPTRERAS
jgi:hypothetical protein